MPLAFGGRPTFEGKSEAEWKEVEVHVSSWRLSQFLRYREIGSIETS